MATDAALTGEFAGRRRADRGGHTVFQGDRHPDRALRRLCWPPCGAGSRGRRADPGHGRGGHGRGAGNRGDVGALGAAVLLNGLGRYQEALAAARQATEPGTRSLGVGAAGTDRGRRAQREHAPGRRSHRPAGGTTRAGGTEWGWASRHGPARCSARATPRRNSTGRRSTGSAAPGAVRSWPAPTCSTANGCAARRRRTDAREQLRTAHDMLAEIGMEAFAGRARRELRPPAKPPASAPLAAAGPASQRADRPGGPGRAARPRRPVQPGDRRPAVHQPPHGPVPPEQGLRQARHQLSRPAPPGAARRAGHLLAALAPAAAQSPGGLPGRHSSVCWAVNGYERGPPQMTIAERCDRRGRFAMVQTTPPAGPATGWRSDYGPGLEAAADPGGRAATLA